MKKKSVALTMLFVFVLSSFSVFALSTNDKDLLKTHCENVLIASNQLTINKDEKSATVDIIDAYLTRLKLKSDVIFVSSQDGKIVANNAQSLLDEVIVQNTGYILTGKKDLTKIKELQKLCIDDMQKLKNK